jgi:hypothetical protein
VMPSAQLAHHLARLALECLPRTRRGPLMSRLIHNPAGILRKGLAAWRLLRRDRGLRGILAAYRRQPGLRRTVSVHALLDDLLRLDLIRAARQGTLRTRQSFTVGWEYDVAAAALVAVSARGLIGADDTAPGTGPASAGSTLPAEALDALAQGRVRALVWDHTAVAPQVVCRAGRSRWLTYTLGQGGIYRFRALEKLYQADAGVVGGALVAMLGGADRPARRSTT